MRKIVPKSVLVVVLCACWILPGLFNHEPWKADEPYTFGMVLHILRTGDWVVPTVAGVPFVEKPPLYFLTAALFARLFSPLLPLHDGARLASGFFLLVAFLFAGQAGKQLWGAGKGFTTVALLLASVGLVLNGHLLITDTALFAGCAIAIFGLVLSKERPAAGGAWLGLGVGIGFLSKGLLAPAIFGLAALLLPALFSSWRTREYARALGIAALTALPLLSVWPLALYSRSPALFREWLWLNNFGRFFGFAHLGPRNTGNYPLLLVFFAFPSYLLAAWGVWRKARGGMREMESIAAPLAVFLVTMAVLETASDGRDLYALPLLLPLSLIAAPVVPALPRWSSAFLHRLGTAFFTVVILALWTGWAALTTGHPAALADWLHRIHPSYVPSFRPLSTLIAVLLTATGLLLDLRNPGSSGGERAVLRWATGITVSWGIAMAVLLPWMDAGNSYKDTMVSLAKVLPRGTTVIDGVELGESQRAMLDYYIGVTVRRFDPKGLDRHDLLLVKDLTWKRKRIGAEWSEIWEGARPGDTKEVFRLYARNEAASVDPPIMESRRKLNVKKVKGTPDPSAGPRPPGGTAQ